MDEDILDIDIDSRPDSPQEKRLTLVLPSLKSLQKTKQGKKSKSKAFAFGDVGTKPKRPPRPAKLKPLKEVLTKLISNIKRKDDYGFFLEPVNVKQIPGYSDVVQNPMDFGTIGNKVARGKYRSLDDFTNDVRLVTSNAKIFNPPGTIYHAEADKIEAWALEHIEKASSTVIQYETDWNLDPEKEDSDDVNIEDENDPNDPSADMGTPGPSDLQSGFRRSTRAPYKKATTTNNTQKGLSESLDSEGRLPGSKDGLGVFPPGSALAKTMLDLKLKGKKYKTKKERMRIEKEGPPFRSDGSLDYYQMEEPFSLFTDLAPTPLARPLLTPVYAPVSTSQQQLNVNPAQSQTPQPSTSFPIPTTVPLTRSQHQPAPPKGRHWVVTRNTNYRRGKDREDENEESSNSWKASREAHATDFGSFALLAGELAEEMRRRGISVDDEQQTMENIKDSLDCDASRASRGWKQPYDADEASYWSTARTAEAEDHIRDVVYGGIEGFAYVRSLAEFVTPPEVSLSTDKDTVLGMSLATWVEHNVVDPLTGYQHSFLREVGCQLPRHLDGSHDQKPNDAISSQLYRSLHVYPRAHQTLQLLLQMRTHSVDMASLIRVPDEIYLSEKEWFGNMLSSEQVKEEDSMEVDGDSASSETNQSKESSTVEQLNQVLSYVANAIVSYDKQRRAGQSQAGESQMKDMGGTGANPPEDAVLRNIRLNLLALAKRVPFDKLALLPRDLVPEQIRHVIPTAPSTPAPTT